MNAPSVEAAAQIFVKIFVTDLDRSAAFYSAGLGFVAGARFSAPEFDELVLRPGEGVRGGSLVLCRWRDGRDLALGNAHGPLGLKVDDVDAAHGRILAAGGASRIAPLDFEGSRLAILSDPDGHALELIAFPRQGQHG